MQLIHLYGIINKAVPYINCGGREKYIGRIYIMGKRIMVVDDEDITLKTCEFILQKNGYEVVTMNSGQKCLDYMRVPGKPRIDLVLLDIEMPILNGYNTLARIRQTAGYQKVPVIFLTATATHETVKEAIRLGANSYIKKPFLPQDLIDRVSDIIKRFGVNTGN